MNNRTARLCLERKYGKGCMFKKADIPTQIEKLRTIKTYKTFLKETRYTGKKIRLLENNMTYHHLKHKSDGGKATEENGAVVNELAHRYLHSLPREQEEIINNMLRQYKLQISGGVIQATDKGLEPELPYVIDLELDLNDCDTIPVYTTEQTPSKKPKQKYNRAKSKRAFNRFVEDELDYMNSTEYEVISELKDTLKSHAQSVLSDEDKSIRQKQEDFEVIEDFVHYVDNYQENQKKLQDYDRMIQQDDERGR